MRGSERARMGGRMGRREKEPGREREGGKERAREEKERREKRESLGAG
jgi:hypothetical protein